MPASDDDKGIHTWVVAFEADDDTARTAAVVIGTVLENFRGLKMAEFTDETALAEPDGTAMDVLHSVLTAADRLTKDQRSAIDDFVAAIEQWEQSEREGGQ